MDATAVCIVKVLFVFQKLVIDFPQLFVEAVFSGGTVVIFIVILAAIGVLSVFDVPKFIVHLAAVVAGTAGGKSCGLSVPEIFLLLKFVQKLVLLLRVVLESVAQGARGATSASGSSAPSQNALHFHHPVNIVTIIIVQMAAPVSLLLGSHVNVEVSSLQLLPQLLPELNDGSAHRVGLCAATADSPEVTPAFPPDSRAMCAGLTLAFSRVPILVDLTPAQLLTVRIKTDAFQPPEFVAVEG